MIFLRKSLPLILSRLGAPVVQHDPLTYDGTQRRALREQLPRYAVPTFLRVSDKPAETTGNNKVVKRSLLKEGIDLASISGGDKILWARPGAEKYVELTQADYETLSQGKAKL